MRCFWPLVFRFSLGWVVRKPEGLHLNETHSHLVYADHVNLFGKNVSTTKENLEAFLLAGKELGLEVNSSRTTDQFLSFEQIAGQ